MHLTRFLTLKLLKYNFFNKIFFYLIYTFYLKNKEKIRLNYFKGKFDIFNEKKNQKNLCLFNNLFSARSSETISFYVFILNIFKFNNLRPAIFSSFKFLSLIKSSKIKALPPLLSFNNLLYNQIPEFRSFNEIKKYKWKKISCGIFALSSTFRELKSEEFNLKSFNHLKIFEKNLNKSISYVEAFNNFFNNHKVGAAVFSDPGYVGQGEMFEILTNKNIPCYQFFMSIDENKIIFKKYLKKNQREHFDKISDKNWNRLSKKKNNQKQLKNSLNNIKKLYLKNNWFPSVGTTRSEKFYSKKDIYKILKIDKSKPTAVIFNHIFWDGTFFYGKDAFATYREWFLETIKIANKNNNLNWIIKPHPANKVQNLRDGIDENFTEEEKIIKKTFGFMPNNLKILKNDNKINSWSLYQILDYCVTIRGTPGIESALFGAETIITGSGRYENRGFTKYFKNKNNYLKYLSKLTNFHKKKSSTVRNATLYADSVFFKKPMSLNSISVKFKNNKTADMDLKIKFNSQKEFLKNKDVINLISWINSGNEEFYLDN